MKNFGLLGLLALNLIFVSISLSAEDRERSSRRRQPTPEPISSKPSSSIQLAPVKTLMRQQESQPVPSDQLVESTQSISPATVNYNIKRIDTSSFPLEEMSISLTTFERGFTPEEPISQTNEILSPDLDMPKSENETMPTEPENEPTVIVRTESDGTETESDPNIGEQNQPETIEQTMPEEEVQGS